MCAQVNDAVGVTAEDATSEAMSVNLNAHMSSSMCYPPNYTLPSLEHCAFVWYCAKLRNSVLEVRSTPASSGGSSLPKLDLPRLEQCNRSMNNPCRFECSQIGCFCVASMC